MPPTALARPLCPLAHLLEVLRALLEDQVPQSRTTCRVASRSAVVPPIHPPKTTKTQTTVMNLRTAVVHLQVINVAIVCPPPMPHLAAQGHLPPTRAEQHPPTIFLRHRCRSPPGDPRHTRTLAHRRRSPSVRRRPRSSRTKRPRCPLPNTRPVAHTGITPRSSSTPSSTRTSWGTHHI